MIELQLEGQYCHNCPRFEVECDAYDLGYGNNEHRYDYYIRCANRDVCKGIRGFFENRNK